MLHSAASASPRFHPFELEYYQSRYEHDVEINLADSSVKCVGGSDWLTAEEQRRVLATPLFYPMVNGTLELRRSIAALYRGAGPENILVTVGAAQANSMVAATLLQPGDEVVVVSPGYRQIWGLALNIGCTVRELRLRPERDWRPDLDELDSLVGPRTRLVSVVNPNNPTGIAFTEPEMSRVVAACARAGAWLHADEVYHGTERAGPPETPSFWGRYDRVVCTNSLSKAYGLAGLRIGWAIAAPDTIEELWRRHEYAVIAAAAPSMTMADIALGPAKRAWLLERQRDLSRAGWAVLEKWLASQNGRFSVRPSAATCIGFVHYDLPVSSFELAEHIRTTERLLVAPGEFMGADGHLRITLGYAPDKVRRGLDRVARAAERLANAETTTRQPAALG
ncbi:MAG TPA: aminotransferase class I/II-fold pyridoxal phosphate-dependent enzyme [Gemmatimonadaceae bacterium]|nr:aminotransferase class I/II-fold pyridoxal phosphate-dependent enzyme [Gemmatimonadaceae bacterium]